MPFRIALSGLNAASTDLKVTGNNIANASTTGFKESRTEFVNLFASSLQDVGTTSAGQGVRVSRVAQQFSQGSIDFTDNALDMAVNGDGFFILNDSFDPATLGSIEYTRSGAFSLDREGYVVDQAGKYVQIYPPQSTGVATTFQTGVLRSLQLPTSAGDPNETALIDLSLNLDAGEPVPPAFALMPSGFPDTTTYNHSTSTTVYDSLGQAHTASMYYRKTAVPGQWETHLFVTDYDNVHREVTPINPATGVIEFDNAGALISPANGQVVYAPFDLDVAAPDTLVDALGGPLAGDGLTINYQGTTQFGADFGVNDLTQDGYASGRLSGMDIDKTGVIFARFTNGQSLVLGKVALARFNNSQGLRQLGDSNWAETFGSGDAQYGEAGSASFGLIQSGALEGSNVDISAQLINLITAQRNFQANSQVISTADTITQTIINIR